MNLSLYGQETIINFNEGEKTASVYTHNKALRRELLREALTLLEASTEENIFMTVKYLQLIQR